MSDFAKFLEENGLSHRDFARSVSVDPSIVSRLAAGKMIPSLRLAARIERQTRGAIQATSWVKDEPSSFRGGR
ncbi:MULTISPECIES: helix-turn-helix domain-containing protein [Falsigemmobacter]|uniref:Helix-turn-helix domain-containing protein n=2 Tax=Falsigemmobacter TaxID=2780027 RepID=A0A3S3UY91_9RHOB|nr:XRE family transcriptional regulator [Falsigemmobacter faecalis]RWY38516.1 helix-turn-helix domain-containing protein [Falsigemmobacter intermedius]